MRTCEKRQGRGKGEKRKVRGQRGTVRRGKGEAEDEGGEER